MSDSPTDFLANHRDGSPRGQRRNAALVYAELVGIAILAGCLIAGGTYAFVQITNKIAGVL